MAKTEFVQIRFSPEDRKRLFNAAAANYLDPSTWARQVILKAIEDWEKMQKGVPKKVRPASRRKTRRES